MPEPRLAPGMRRTRQRRLVWEALEALGPHCTAEEIAASVERRQPGFHRSTVYRALEALTASGAVHSVHLGDGPTHYELATDEHQHAVCQACRSILHLEDSLLEELHEHLEERHRFKPVRTEVLVVGICDACGRAGGHGRRPAARRRTVDHVHYGAD
ncbi:MAG: Fur family transcriptional regulator [Candidatus Dormibacteraceae bacterium]